jgi:cytochrome P450
MATVPKFNVPPHVPPELVVPFDQFHGPEVMRFPPEAVDRIAAEHPVFFSSCYGGYWMVTRYEDVRAAFQAPEIFKQWNAGIPVNPFTKIYKPLYLDPPEHMKWRRLLVPIFAPRQVARLEAIVRCTARRELARIAPLGRCEFVQDFAGILPATMFCGQLGLPQEEYPRFGAMAKALIYGPAKALKEGDLGAARAVRARANKEIDELIARLIPQRRRHPGDDIVSILLTGQVDGQPLPDEEIINITTLLFFAGTDSTRAAIAYAFIYLAQNPAQRDRLVADPALIKDATDELLRFNGFHMISRQATRDTVIAGVRIKAGDLVVLSIAAANHDPTKFPDPLKVDFGREHARQNLTFGAGVHRCIGMPLAKLQLQIALEEVHQAIPDYRLDPEGEPVRYLGGQGKAVPENLPLVFTPRQYNPAD